MYRQNAFRFSLSPDITPRNNCESLLRYSHYNNNVNAVPKDHPDYDPLVKVEPLLCALREQLKTCEPDQEQCIDEQMIPFKGRSHLKKYLKKKPKKWGFKVCTRSEM